MSRTGTVLRQATLGLGLKVGGVAVAFASVPLALNMLGPTEMGVWLVLLSGFQWITLFDLGIGMGARNEIARAAAQDNHPAVQRAVTTGWVITGTISAAIGVLLILVLCLTVVPAWMSTRVFGGVDVSAALWIVAGAACVAFAVNYVQTVFSALERPVIQAAYAFSSNAVFALMLLAARQAGLDTLAGVTALYAAAMLGCGAGFVLLFRHKHPSLWPSRSHLDLSLCRPIIRKSLRLFVIQLCALAIFTTDRLLVSAWVSPEAVVSYDSAYRLFSLITMTHTLLLNSAFSSFTQAFERGEWTWIRSTLRRLCLLMLPLTGGALLMAMLAPWLVRHWLGQDQVGPAILYAAFALATLLGCWSNVFAYFLSAISDTRVQLRSALLATALNFPASWFFAVELKLGATGIVLGTCCALSLFSVLGPLRTRRRFVEHPVAV
jgi:O-antigen/teichoic acid export membrane protein